MAYTPINWQTGDTITADKLNRCDNGWAVESAQLFSETVTTVDQGGMYSAELAYSQLIDDDTITVAFDGTEYVCPRIDLYGECFYGGFGETGPDFTDYPFAIESNDDISTVYTETAGTHTIAAVGNAIATSSDFSVAVGKCLPILKVELGKTTFQEVEDAVIDGLFVYGWDDDNGRMFYALNTFTDSENSEYYLYALTRQPAEPTPTIAEFVASSPTDPLHA